MRPVLAILPAPSLFIILIVLACLALAIGGWLAWLRRYGRLTSDHTYTGVTLLVMCAIVLFVLRRIGEVHINAYGTMLMLGFIAGTYSGARLGRRRGISAERILDLGLIILVGAIIGARALYVLITPGETLLNIPRIMHEGLGGLSFHGGLIGGFLAGGIYIWLTGLNYWRVVDTLAPSVAIGYAITRIGCFLNGCCFGKAAPDLPWAMKFPHSPELYPHTIAVHPTQLYASAMGLLMFGILLLLARGSSQGRAGRVFMALLMLEGAERFVMEIYRFPDPNFHGLLTPAQWASIVLVIAGIIGWFVLPKVPAVVELAVATGASRQQQKAAVKR